MSFGSNAVAADKGGAACRATANIKGAASAARSCEWKDDEVFVVVAIVTARAAAQLAVNTTPKEMRTQKMKRAGMNMFRRDRSMTM